ncbi:MAG: restriction endonuclease subunit S [Candidatus Roizmanbacteria bacterium]
MNTNWKKVKLGDVCDLQQGLAINKKSKHLIVNRSDLPLLRITDLINNKVEQYIDSKRVGPQFIADDSSLIYTRTGQVGLVFKNRKGVVHNNCFKIKPFADIDINYLYYLLKQESIYFLVNKVASRAAQPDLTHSSFKAIEVFVITNLQEQKKIASLISSYDDLIEINQKRIKILEEMAQLLYTEWFVKFKFPGHEKVKLIDSGTEYGKIPDG